MIFWGVNVQGGETRRVPVSQEDVLHITNVALDVSGNSEPVPAYVNITVNVAGTKFALTSLHTQRLRREMFDEIFEQSFTISHNWNGVVSFTGYTTQQPSVHDVFLPDYADGDEQKDLVEDAVSKKMQAMKFDSREEKEDACGSQKGGEFAADEASTSTS